MTKNNLVRVEIIKTGLNPDSKYATLQEDLSIKDSHPNIFKGESRIGTVYLDDLIPRLGYSYEVCYDTKVFLTSKIKKISNFFTFTTDNSIYQINILDRLVNYQYELKYLEVIHFEFNRKNILVDLTNYQTLVTHIPRVVNILKKDKDSRKALIVLSDNGPEPSCLISLQFLIKNSDLICLANYRSQHATLGLPHDIRLLNFLITNFIKEYSFNFENVNIIVNVADFHNYKVAE